MKIKKNELIGNIILIILIFAVFNDVIRIPNTALSAYRLCLPIATLFIMKHAIDIRKLFVVGLMLGVMLIVQNVVFCSRFGVDETIDFKWQITYFIHYVYIIISMLLVRVLKTENYTLYKNLLFKIIPVIGLFCIIAYILRTLLQWTASLLANRNNYAVCLAIIFPIYFIEGIYGKKHYYILCGIILTILWIGDSKAAIMGIAVEIVVLEVIHIIKRFKEGNRIAVFFIAGGIAALLALCLSPLTINGYSIRYMFLDMVSRIKNGNVYSEVYSSLAFRINCIIYMLQAIAKSYFIGIGLGNSGKLIAASLNLESLQLNAGEGAVTVSPHWALLEFFSDCGIWAIILCLYIFLFAIKKLFRIKNFNKIDMYFIAFTISLPIWSMSASGFYTLYLVFIVIAWLYEWYKDDNESYDGRLLSEICSV